MDVSKSRMMLLHPQNINQNIKLNTIDIPPLQIHNSESFQSSQNLNFQSSSHSLNFEDVPKNSIINDGFNLVNEQIPKIEALIDQKGQNPISETSQLQFQSQSFTLPPANSLSTSKLSNDNLVHDVFQSSEEKRHEPYDKDSDNINSIPSINTISKPLSKFSRNLPVPELNSMNLPFSSTNNFPQIPPLRMPPKLQVQAQLQIQKSSQHNI